MAQLNDEITAYGNRKGAKVTCHKAQIGSRIVRMKPMDLEYPMSPVSAEYRSAKTKKIVVTAPVKGHEAEYLTGLAAALMTHDAQAPEVATFVSKHFLRNLPRICRHHTFESSIKAKSDFEREVGELVRAVDDQDLANLSTKY